MAGYQGWFNTPGDGAGRNWHHYEKGRRFEPGWCTIDLWPEVDEYPQLYETAFRFEDGTPAYVPSPYDKSTVDVHFRWMKEYGLDGVFLQRFIAEIANPSRTSTTALSPSCTTSAACPPMARRSS